MLSHFCISQCGESHFERDDDCQDASLSKSVFAQRFNTEYIVAVIADGVGSCDFSKEGACKAVDSFVACVEHNLVNGTANNDDEGMLHILEHSFKWALKSVNELSKKEELPFGLFDSTLTGVIYDGSTAWFGHAGDDGIVVMHADGSFEAITHRHEGEEPGSVRPLRNHATWEFDVSQNVASLVLMTDGVYDKCVGSDAFGARVRLPFLRPLLYAEIDSDYKAEQIREAWDAFLSTEPDNVELDEEAGYEDLGQEPSEKSDAGAGPEEHGISEREEDSVDGNVPTADNEPLHVDNFDPNTGTFEEAGATLDGSFSNIYGGPGFDQNATPPRNYIRDDITIVLVSNSDLVRNLPEYCFDEDAFDAETKRIRLENERRLAEISQQRWKEQRERERQARERVISQSRRMQTSTPSVSVPIQPVEPIKQPMPADTTVFSSTAVHGRHDSNDGAQPPAQFVSMRPIDSRHINWPDSHVPKSVPLPNRHRYGTNFETRVEGSTSTEEVLASLEQMSRAFRSTTASMFKYVGEKIKPKPEEYESRGDESGGKR